MHHSDFIENLAKIYKPKIYLELGLFMGETFGKVRKHAERAIGVDLILPEGLEGELFQESTNAFFKHFNEMVDMVFIDADHTLEAVTNDFINASEILNPAGIIILHDTDPEHKRLTDPGFCGDCYKLVWELEEDENINAVTLPVSEAGLTIVTWKNQLRINE